MKARTFCRFGVAVQLFTGKRNRWFKQAAPFGVRGLELNGATYQSVQFSVFKYTLRVGVKR